MISLSVSQSNKLTRAFFFTSQPVCIITAIYVLPSAFLKQSPIDLQCLILLYAASFFIYNAERLWSQSTEDQINHPERTQWIEHHRCLLNYLCICAGLITLFTAMQMSPAQQTLIALSGLPSILYLLPNIKFRGNTLRWRQFPAAKELSVAFAWSLAVCLLPLASSPSYLHKPISLYFLLCTFFAALCNVIMCDLKDRKGDSINQVTSLASLNPKLAYQTCFWISMSGFVLSFLLSLYSPLFLGFSITFLSLFILNKKHLHNKLFIDLSLFGPCSIVFILW